MQIKTKIVSTHTAYFKPVKQEVNGTVILPPLVFPEKSNNLTRSLFNHFSTRAEKDDWLEALFQTIKELYQVKI